MSEQLGQQEWLLNPRCVLYQGENAKVRIIDDAKVSSFTGAYTSVIKLQLNRRPNPQASLVTDWIGGMFPANNLQVWFPAHWFPLLSAALQSKVMSTDYPPRVV